MKYPTIAKSFRHWRKTVTEADATCYMEAFELQRLCALVDRYYEPGCHHKILKTREGFSMILVAPWVGVFDEGQRYLASSCTTETDYAIRYGTAFERERGFLPKGMVREKAIPDGEIETFVTWCIERGIAIPKNEITKVSEIVFPNPNAEMEFRVRWE